MTRIKRIFSSVPICEIRGQESFDDPLRRNSLLTQRAEREGVVALGEAFAAVAGLLTMASVDQPVVLVLDDLPGAGWTVTPWTRTKGGGAVLVGRKPFDRPEQVAGIVRELSGSDGPLQKFAAASR